MKAGDKVKFTRDIYDDACGDHPFILYAVKGDTATVDCVDDDGSKIVVLLDNGIVYISVSLEEVERVASGEVL